MLHKIFTSFMLLGMTIGSTLAADFTGSLYIEDATVIQGEIATLSVQLNNSIDIRSFEFMLSLPQGIDYVSWSLSTERLPNGVTMQDQLSMHSYKNHNLRVASILNYGEDAAFTGSMGEIAQIAITVDPSIAEGDYTLLLSDIDVATPEGKDYSDFTPVPFTLHVISPLAITSLPQEPESPAIILNAMGIRQSSLSSGVNILRHADGSTEKIGIK